MSLISFSNRPSHSDFLCVVFFLVLTILSRSLSDTYYLFSLKVHSSVVSFSIYQFVPFSFFYSVIFISLSWTYLLHMSFSLFVSISLFIICFILSFTRLLTFSFIFLFPLLVLFLFGTGPLSGCVERLQEVSISTDNPVMFNSFI